MRIEILDEAEEELREAAAWYEARVRGLGHALLEEVIEAFDQIAKHPRRYFRITTRKNREIRRMLLDRFPYAVVDEMFRDRPVVLAIAHGARRPGYWRSRCAR
jgi:toxin ParE1/3/4